VIANKNSKMTKSDGQHEQQEHQGDGQQKQQEDQGDDEQDKAGETTYPEIFFVKALSATHQKEA
jgi:hypothetical protein